jgi:hypothetical protein
VYRKYLLFVFLQKKKSEVHEDKDAIQMNMEFIGLLRRESEEQILRPTSPSKYRFQKTAILFSQYETEMNKRGSGGGENEQGPIEIEPSITQLNEIHTDIVEVPEDEEEHSSEEEEVVDDEEEEVDDEEDEEDEEEEMQIKVHDLKIITKVLITSSTECSVITCL